MLINKRDILQQLSYTDLVYDRINKKLHTQLSRKQIEALIVKVLTATANQFFTKIGKNFYVTNTDYQIKVTINSHTFRIITVDRIGPRKQLKTY